MAAVSASIDVGMKKETTESNKWLIEDQAEKQVLTILLLHMILTLELSETEHGHSKQ